MPGGVNSPVRAFNAVGGAPLFIKRANGSKIIEVDGNGFIDYVASWGPLIFGHAHPSIVEAITRQAELGTSYGASTELEIELAEKVVNYGTQCTTRRTRSDWGISGVEQRSDQSGQTGGSPSAKLREIDLAADEIVEPRQQGEQEDYGHQTVGEQLEVAMIKRNRVTVKTSYDLLKTHRKEQENHRHQLNSGFPFSQSRCYHLASTADSVQPETSDHRISGDDGNHQPDADQLPKYEDKQG